MAKNGNSTQASPFMTYGSVELPKQEPLSDQGDVNINELYKQFIELREEIKMDKEVWNIMEEIKQMTLDAIQMLKDVEMFIQTLKDVEMFKQLMLLILSE